MERHLFIIWEKGLNKKDDIVKTLSKEFKIILEIFCEWDKKYFSKNISRFYGVNLKNKSHKIKHCGNGPFYLIVIEDSHPVYGIRKTSKGFCYVNVNVFDKKLEYRRMTGGGHKIHGTNSTKEYINDIKKLLPKTWDNLNFIKNEKKLRLDQIDNKWNSLKELFTFLNDCEKYVILRNYQNLEKEVFNCDSLHPDIDILCENPKNIADLIGAKKTSKKSYRRQYYIFINEQKIFLDLRALNENYYCYDFSNKILEDRIKYKYFFVPNKLDHFYSLVYHSLIHKKEISSDYIHKISVISRELGLNFDFNLNIDLFKILNKFLLLNNFKIVEPNDLSVYYNLSLIRNFYPARISASRNNYNLFVNSKYVFFKIIKKIIGEKATKKIKNIFS